MPKYRSHKVVEAAKIEKIGGQYGREHGATLHLHGGAEVEVDRAYLDKHEPKVGGYYVRYPPQGYESWSPADVFEEGYSPLEVTGCRLQCGACEICERGGLAQQMRRGALQELSDALGPMSLSGGIAEMKRVAEALKRAKAALE